MLDTRDWSKLGGLLFVAKGLVEGLWAGRHASARSGSGLEFHDYRAYTPGDDPADVDWKLFGRTDRYFVRRHRQYTDLDVYLLVDCSASMNFAGLDSRGRPRGVAGSRGFAPARDSASAPPTPGPVTKLHYAATLAAAIAFLTIRQSDRAGLGLFADRLLSHAPAGGAWPHLQRLCAELEKARPVVKPGDVGASLRQAHAVLSGRGALGGRERLAGAGRRALLVLISDLLDETGPLFDGLARFRHHGSALPGSGSASAGGEVVVFQVLTRQEIDLAGLSRLQLQLVDAETRRQVPADLRRLAPRYAEVMSEHLSVLRRGCAARGICYHLLTTDQPVVAALRRYLMRRSARTG